MQKVRLAEDGWNPRDPAKVALAYAIDSRWRNRSGFIKALRRDKRKIPPLRDKVSHLSSQVLDLAFGRRLKSLCCDLHRLLVENPKSPPINDSQD